MIVLRQKWILREDLRNNQNWIYVFGDNEARYGIGGQAKEMRGEPNAFGIPTLAAPNVPWTDETYNWNVQILEEHFDVLGKHDYVVLPADGIGTGLARLEESAPRTFARLQELWQELLE